MQRYDTYKDSGVKWLGEIPSHWEVCRFKNLVSLVTTPSNDSNKIGLENIESGSGKFIQTENEFEGNGVHFQVNDVVYGKLRPYLQKVWLATFSGNAVGDFFIFRVNNKVVGKYLQYLMLSRCFTDDVNASTYGAKMPRVSSEYILTMRCAVPSIDEQIKMVSYLDTATAKIDAAIAQQQNMIDLLNERKQIIIDRAVTKGLNPNAKMKDSGVEWIGEVPEEWEILALKYIIRPKKKLVGRNSKNYDLLSLSLKGIIKRDMDNPDGKWPASFDTYQEVLPGDFVFCNFDNEETPRAVGLSSYKGMITGAYDVMCCYNKNVDTQYLLYYLLYIDNGKRFKPLYKGLRKTVPIDSLMGFKIPIPPMKEQVELVNRLVSQTRKIDGIIQSVSNQISLLQERKQIIINEVVTGKVKVV